MPQGPIVYELRLGSNGSAWAGVEMHTALPAKPLSPAAHVDTDRQSGCRHLKKTYVTPNRPPSASAFLCTIFFGHICNQPHEPPAKSTLTGTYFYALYKQSINHPPPPPKVLQSESGCHRFGRLRSRRPHLCLQLGKQGCPEHRCSLLRNVRVRGIIICMGCICAFCLIQVP